MLYLLFNVAFDNMSTRVSFLHDHITDVTIINAIAIVGLAVMVGAGVVVAAAVDGGNMVVE